MNIKGLSIMISYVLLIAIVLILSTISYKIMTSYVLKDIIECPEGVSLYVKESNCNPVDLSLNFTLSNNGRFNIGGYFIHATNSSTQELASEDLSQKITEGGINSTNYVTFTSEENNIMTPYDEIQNIFNIDNEIYSIEIIPVRFQEENNRLKLAICGDSKIKELINCKFNPSHLMGFISWWDLEGNLNDIMGMNNGEIFGADCNVAGKVGQGCEFIKSEGDYMIIPDSSSLDITDELAITFWIYPYTAQGITSLFDKDKGESGYKALLMNGNYIKARVGDTAFGDPIASPPDSIILNEWNHVVFNVNSTNQMLYINSEQVAIDDVSLPIGINMANMTIGASGDVNGQFFDGIMDEIMIFNRSITEREIDFIYNYAN